MKLSLTQENLAAGLAVVSPVAGKSAALPILQNILLEAKEGALKLKATNLEIGVTAEVRGKIEEEGVFTVNGRLLHDYVALLNPGKVDLELEGEHLLVRAPGQQTKIHGLAAEEFPVIPEMEDGAEFAISAAEAAGAVSQVLFAVSLNDARPEISGVLIKTAGKNLVLAGTDSYRLAERKIALDAQASAAVSCIVPLRAMQELSRILSRSEGRLRLKINPNQILFSAESALGGVDLISRVITGNYPNYEQIIPSAGKTAVALSKEPLLRAVKSAALFCRQGLNHVTLQFSSDKILVSSSASQVGENIAEVPAKIEGKDIDIVFDYRYVLDGLAAIAGSDVKIKLNDGSTPGIFAGKDENYLYLVMPIKQ